MPLNSSAMVVEKKNWGFITLGVKKNYKLECRVLYCSIELSCFFDLQTSVGFNGSVCYLPLV